MLPKNRILTLCALAVTGALANAQGGLQSFGPLNEFGYPNHYTDHGGLSLDHCWDQNDPLCGVPPADFIVGEPHIDPDPALTNFFHETFYWSAFSAMAIPGRGDAELVMAIEGAFGNADESERDGDQVVFSRLRIRLRGDGFTAGVYRISTPYGVFEFDAPAVDPGRRIVNFTADCLHLPVITCGNAPGPGANFFSTPLGVLDDGTIDPSAAPIGPNFLVWDPAVLPLAPAGYVGDPLVPHPVIGATPGNANEFRVEYSPNGNFGGNTVFDESTNLFNVMGRIAAVDPCDGAAPTADFGASPLSGNAPLSVVFNDLSSCATSWDWDFGDGNSSTEQSPAHTYTTPGTYTVSLSVNGGAAVETKIDLITVNEPPVGNGLTLDAPIPGVAGVPNLYVIRGATPGRVAGIYAGLSLGNTVLNIGGCGGLPIGLDRPNRLIGRGTANGAGVVSLTITPPPSSAGKIFHHQAVEPFSCRQSNIVSEQL